MRRHKRPVRIIKHINLAQFLIHQKPSQPSNPQRSRAVRTRRASHDGTQNVIEQADGHIETKPLPQNLQWIAPASLRQNQEPSMWRAIINRFLAGKPQQLLADFPQKIP